MTNPRGARRARRARRGGSACVRRRSTGAGSRPARPGSAASARASRPAVDAPDERRHPSPWSRSTCRPTAGTDRSRRRTRRPRRTGRRWGSRHGEHGARRTEREHHVPRPRAETQRGGHVVAGPECGRRVTHGWQRTRPIEITIDDLQQVVAVLPRRRRPVPVPDASPRSVEYSPVNRHVSQSCGSITRSMRSKTSGSVRCNHESFVIVNAATGTEPQAAAQPAAPSSSCFSNQPASGADSVSFHNFAARNGVPPASVTTSPCCCAAIETAAQSSRPPASARAISNAFHQSTGSCSERGGLVGGCGARPERTNPPVSESRTSILVDCVDESTPATSTYRTPSNSSVTSWSRRSWP